MVYRSNGYWGSDDQNVDILRQMQVYDNYVELTKEYRKHRLEDESEMKVPTKEQFIKGVEKNGVESMFIEDKRNMTNVEKSTHVLRKEENKTSKDLQTAVRRSDFINTQTVVNRSDDILAMVSTLCDSSLQSVLHNWCHKGYDM